MKDRQLAHYVEINNFNEIPLDKLYYVGENGLPVIEATREEIVDIRTLITEDHPLRRGFPQSGWIGFFVGGVPTWPNYLADSVMEGDVRQLIHKTPHVRYTFARERRSRDGHHVAVGPHHLADDFSLHARDAGQPPQGGGLSGSQRASKASIGERQRQKRAKIAPTRYWNGRDVSV